MINKVRWYISVITTGTNFKKIYKLKYVFVIMKKKKSLIVNIFDENLNVFYK